MGGRSRCWSIVSYPYFIKIPQYDVNGYMNCENLLHQLSRLCDKKCAKHLNDTLLAHALSHPYCVITSPLFSSGNVYNIPVCLWLLDTYPYNPPICFVKPTSTMMIKTGKHIDANGKIYLPYLHEWKHVRPLFFNLLDGQSLNYVTTIPLFRE